MKNRPVILCPALKEGAGLLNSASQLKEQALAGVGGGASPSQGSSGVRARRDSGGGVIGSHQQHLRGPSDGSPFPNNINSCLSWKQHLTCLPSLSLPRPSLPFSFPLSLLPFIPSSSLSFSQVTPCLTPQSHSRFLVQQQLETKFSRKRQGRQIPRQVNGENSERLLSQSPD